MQSCDQSRKVFDTGRSLKTDHQPGFSQNQTKKYDHILYENVLTMEINRTIRLSKSDECQIY